jgi:hypothetical protein
MYRVADGRAVREAMDEGTERIAREEIEKQMKKELRGEANSSRALLGSNVHPDVPVWRGGECRGIFRYDDVEVPLHNTRKGPGEFLRTLPGGKDSGLNAIVPDHVEGHAAGIMHKYGIKEAEIFIN